MKKGLLLLSFFCSFLCSFGSDGQVVLRTRSIDNPDHSGTHDAPIFRPDGTGAGQGFIAGLFLQQPGGLTLLGTQTFRTNSFTQFLVHEPVNLFVTGISPGAYADFVVCCWQIDYGSYEFSPVRGKAGPFHVGPLGGTSSDGIPYLPAEVKGFYGFTMAVAPPLLVQNGNFELFSKNTNLWSSPGISDFVQPGMNDLAGWTIESEVELSALQTNIGGHYSIDLGGSPSAGSLSQSISTEPGKNYLVTFNLSGNPDPRYFSETPVKRVLVEAGASSNVFKFDISTELNSLDNMKWKKVSLPFLATTSSTLLRFSSASGSLFAGAMIDNVIVGEYQPPALDVQLTARICWPTAEGLTYQIQICTSPRLDTWDNVGDPIAGSGGDLCITDDVTIGAASQFYRITLVP